MSLDQPARVTIVSATLDALERRQADLLVLSAAVGKVPLRGLAGLVDWRLCGRLSTALRQYSPGNRPEALLFQCGKRLAFPRVVLLSLPATTSDASPSSEQAWQRVSRICKGLGCASLIVDGLGCDVLADTSGMTLPRGTGGDRGLRDYWKRINALEATGALRQITAVLNPWATDRLQELQAHL